MSLLLKYIGVVFLLIPFTSFAQQTIRGVVLEYQNEVRLEGVEITNLRTDQMFKTNGLGLFNVTATVGDTLRVLKSGFNEQNVIISSEEDLVIRLKGITELRAVNVYGTTKEEEMNNALKDYRKQGSFYNGKPPVLAYIFSPLSALHETFGKTGKHVRRFREYVSYEQDELLVDRKFNKTLISNLTGLKDEDLLNFALTYRPSYETAKDWNEYDATKYIKKAFEQFEANGRPPAPSLPKLD